MLATVVETGNLLRTVAVSLVAGIGVTLIFSITLWGAIRSVDLGRAERRLAAGAAASLAVAGLLTTLAVIVIGIVVMMQK
jgi:hypothetical protein